MKRMLQVPVVAIGFCLGANLAGFDVQAAAVKPSWDPRNVQASAETTTDPVMPVVASIGQPSEMPRLDPAPPVIAPQRPNIVDGANEFLFAGGVASATGVLRLLEGVSTARDPVQLLPYEPTVAVRISAPGAELLLLAAAALIALRSRARTRRQPRA